MDDFLTPPPSLLAKLGSIVVHADELISSDGHEFDRDALAALLSNEDVREWILAMHSAAMVPLKRSPTGD